MSSRVTERTLYPFIGRVFERFGWRYFSETGLDLVLEGDGAKVISEVKIDSEIQLTKAITEADQKARRLGTRNVVALLFSSYVRDITLSELERNYPRMRVSAIVLTDWLTDRRELALEDLAEAFSTSFRDWFFHVFQKVNLNQKYHIGKRKKLQELREKSLKATFKYFCIHKVDR